MTVHHEITGASMAELMTEIDAITAQAVADARTYHIGISRHPEGVTAVITVYQKKDAENA